MIRWHHRLALAALALGVILVADARADAPSIGIDLRPIMAEVVIPFLAALITALAGSLIAWVLKRLDLTDTEQGKLLGEIADRALKMGLEYARAVGDKAVERMGPVSTGTPLVDVAANYAIAQIPDTLRRLGYDPNTPEGREAIVRMVRARF